MLNHVTNVSEGGDGSGWGNECTWSELLTLSHIACHVCVCNHENWGMVAVMCVGHLAFMYGRVCGCESFAGKIGQGSTSIAERRP